MNTKVSLYFTDGCGRCLLGGTPNCKVNHWPGELRKLRKLLLDCGLNEELKWGVPCYTFKGKNVVILAAFKGYCALSFFKGSLLQDTHQLLEKPGENTQEGMLIKFTDVKRIIKNETVLKAYVYEAIEVEKSGVKMNKEAQPSLIIPLEFQTKLNNNISLKNAFYKLTPGRQRGYLLYFSAPKQSKTREQRIEKCLPKIMSGTGLND